MTDKENNTVDSIYAKNEFTTMKNNEDKLVARETQKAMDLIQ